MTNDIAVRVHKDSVVQDSIYGRRVRGLDVFLTVIIYTCAGFSILLLAGIMGYVFVRGIPHVTWAFLSTASSATKGTFGILGNIINTLYIVIITLLIATPLGIGSAVYLNEYAKPGKVVRLIEFTTETLSGIPSIIFGLFGMVFFGNALGLGYSILTGALTLTIMILPLITRTTQEALKTVPDSYRHGALGIGATKWYMIRTILLPSAMPGILTGISWLSEELWESRQPCCLRREAVITFQRICFPKYLNQEEPLPYSSICLCRKQNIMRPLVWPWSFW